jgi:PIN domain nuclease of toxin-antitoxin system
MPCGSSQSRNQIWISATSVWDIAIKRRTGKRTFNGSVSKAINANGCHERPIVPADAAAAGDLAWPHTDPFDRFLVAQAIRLGVTLLTADRVVRTFGGVAQLWAG